MACLNPLLTQARTAVSRCEPKLSYSKPDFFALLYPSDLAYTLVLQALACNLPTHLAAISDDPTKARERRST